MNKKVPVVTKKVTKKPVKLNELQVESIAHYKRMIKWVKTQPETDKPIEYIMGASIKEIWHGDNCAYCTKYASYSKCTNHLKFKHLGKIDVCPLLSKDIPWNIDNESLTCCNGLWYKMHLSITWKEWLSYANKIIKYIKKNG